MTSNEAGKARCPYRIKHILSEPVPGGRIGAKYVYERCLGCQCPRWRWATFEEMPRRCTGTGTLEECLARHQITDCNVCPDREGYCG